MSKYTFKNFQAEYPDDAACLARIMTEQFGGTTLFCSGCGAESRFHAMTKRRAYACQNCGHHIYPCAGTIFEKSRTNLTKWFHAMYLMTSTRNGVAAKEIERQLGVTYKCAWRMAHELRKLMAAGDDHGPLGGHVEIDETIVGGHRTHKQRRSRGTNKSIVMGIVERGGGRLRAGVIPNTQSATLAKVISDNVLPGTTISTDEFPGYRILDVSPYPHGTVNHKEKEWVRGIHHTNTLEGHWSHFKKAIRSTHIHVSGKHLWKYVAEFSYRRNMRHSHALMFDHLLVSVSRPRLQDA
jgi:transposase